MIEVYSTDEMSAWYRGLSEDEANAVDRVVSLLEQMGVGLGHPYSSALKGSVYALRELRTSAGKSELRVIYAFDPNRDAVLVIGGDKGGDSRFYDRVIPWAERIWRDYLAEHEAGEHDER